MAKSLKLSINTFSRKKAKENKASSVKIFVISGPGGAGKTTLLNKLFQKPFIRKKFMRAVSYTTRRKRTKEKKNRDYFFVTKKEFTRLRKINFFIESQRVLNDYYGTPEAFYKQALKVKKNLILCIDVKGGIYLQKKLKASKIVLIFISAPNQEELQHRLQKRVEDNEIIKRRVKLARRELRFSPSYDYLIINKDIKNSLAILEAIFLAEMFRR